MDGFLNFSKYSNNIVATDFGDPSVQTLLLGNDP
jgi:hypothetical protein